MIKTHKPRGYIWTNASALQQTKEFRNISYDDCAASTSKDLLLGPDERLSDAERGRKRRRIEKLADDFLNGQPLFISSARPCPSSLKSTITWNERRSTQSKFTLPEVDIPHDSTAVWQDMEDDEQILRRYCSRLRGHRRQTDLDSIQRISDSGDDVRAQAAPGAAPRMSTRSRPQLTTRPSEEALKQAAALRARRAQKANSEAAPTLKENLNSGKRLRSSSKRSEPKQSADRLLRKQLQTNASQLSNNDESLDELRLSRIETPTNPPKALRNSMLSQSVAQMALSRKSTRNSIAQADSDTIVVTPRTASDGRRNDLHISETSVAGESRNDCLGPNSYHTAPEETGFRVPDESTSEESGDEDEDESQSHDDSQARLLTSHGFKGASPTSWRSVNQQRGAQTTCISIDEVLDASETSAIDTPTGPQPTGRMTRATSAKSKGSEPRPVTAPHGSQIGHPRKHQVVYKIAQAQANDSSPFKWRKRVTFPSSDDIAVAPKQAKHTSQSAPVTPAATSDQRSSNLPGSNLGSNVTYSSPGLPAPASAPADDKRSDRRRTLPETWIGTQAMLFQAQRDLITSPEKSVPDPEPSRDLQIDDPEPLVERASQKSDREPLKQLSQEPMPSTQMMLGDFAGFSTVKKPWRSIPRESIESPSVLLRAKGNIQQSAEDFSPKTSNDLSSKHRGRESSSLRFSIDSAPSPIPSTKASKPPTTTTPMVRRAPDWSSTEVATSTPKGSAGNQTSPVENGAQDTGLASQAGSQSFSFSTAAGLPSFQAAQAWSSLSPREETDIGRMIDDLASELLNTKDMEGILSQVG